ncbi:MAG: hypothetical protein AABX03_02075 [Nanoarchaeota archaeon]
MAKRNKRIEKGIESLKKEIEKHFEKLNEDLREGNIDRGRYHTKEIDKSLIKYLELKINILGVSDDSVKIYRERLDEIKRKFDL